MLNLKISSFSEPFQSLFQIPVENIQYLKQSNLTMYNLNTVFKYVDTMMIGNLR